jgi:Flp pilus assembly CpaE family ATPase
MVSDAPYLIVCHTDPDARARIASQLRDVGRVDAVERLDMVPDLLALAIADCLVVELPNAAAGRAGLGRLVAAYPDMRVVAIAGPLSFDEARSVLRLGVHDLVAAPGDALSVAAAVREGLAPQALGVGGVRGTAVVVAAGKGGVGCTALALHLAAALARSGAAAVLDADAPPFGTIAASADLDAGSSIAGLVRQRLPVDTRLLRRVGLPHAAGFTAFTLWSAAGDADELADAVPATMDALTAGVPFVVVDLGRPVLAAQRLVSRRAAVAVAVAALDLASLRGLRHLLDLLTADAVAHVFPVLNCRGGPSSYTVGQAEAALGTKFAAVLPEAPALRRCADDGTLLGDAVPGDPWWRAVEDLAGRIVDRRRAELRMALGRAQ